MGRRERREVVISKVCDTGRHVKNSGEGMACYGLAKLIGIKNR